MSPGRPLPETADRVGPDRRSRQHLIGAGNCHTGRVGLRHGAHARSVVGCVAGVDRGEPQHRHIDQGQGDEQEHRQHQGSLVQFTTAITQQLSHRVPPAAG